MLTRPLNDFHCLMIVLRLVMQSIRDPDVRALASNYATANDYANDVRSRPQLDDMPGVLPGAPRIGCAPPQRLRFDPPDPNCVERSYSYLSIAEILDPETSRTLATLRIQGQAHTFPVEHTDDGPVPVILDPIEPSGSRHAPENLTYATVARLLGYGPGQPTPMSESLAWAEQVAARDGVQPRNSRDLLSAVERYADAYPGGRQGLAQLAGQIVRPVVDTVGDAAKHAGKAAAGAAKVGARELKRHPRLGQLLRAAIVGYGGPFAVLAIDVVENRLNQRGYTLGSLAQSRDANVFAFK